MRDSREGFFECLLVSEGRTRASAYVRAWGAAEAEAAFREILGESAEEDGQIEIRRLRAPPAMPGRSRRGEDQPRL